jgi:TRAP-type C4-dicarboxylate transport system permease small subunit
MLARFEAAFLAANRTLIFAIMSAMVALVFANVVFRYGFGISLNWVEEVSRYLMVALAFFSAGLAMREGRIVALELVQTLCPPEVGRAMRIAVAVIILVFILTLMVTGVQFAMFAWQNETPVLNIPQGIPYLVVPLGSLVFIIHFVLIFRPYVNRTVEVSSTVESQD